MLSLVERGQQALSITSIPEATDAVRFDLEPLLNCVAQAIDRKDLRAALRYADRARRIAPENTACVLLFAKLLIQGGSPKEALTYLTDESDFRVSLTRCTALFDLGLRERASRCCSDLLRHISSDAVKGLTAFAGDLCEGENSGDHVGWIGIDNQLRLVGVAGQSVQISIELPEGLRYPMEFQSTDGGIESIACALTECPSGRILAQADDSELLGSGLLWPPAFALSAWVALEGNNLVGEAHLGWSPELPVQLVIADPYGSFERIILTNQGPNSFAGSFSEGLSAAELESARIEVSAILPDKTRVPVVGSPLHPRLQLMKKLGEQSKQTRNGPFLNRPKSTSNVSQLIDIIVPVFAGREETLNCLESLFRTTDLEIGDVVVVNDASPEAELCEALLKLAAEDRITLLTNASNLGFAGAANRAMRLHPDRDVILLNSDTEVFGNWVQRLRRSASASVEIGTVTPLGEGGSITDYSRGLIRSKATADQIDRIASTENAGKTSEIPVGVGFCMYIKRDCLNETGELDAAIFGKGYGEENDFCLRARNLGWRHVAAADVFIAHQGARSFGKTKALLQKRNSRVLNDMHPGYLGLLEEFSAADPLLGARRAIDLKRLRNHSTNPVLLITHDLFGGVKRYLDQRQEELTATGHTVLILQRLAADNSSLSVKLTVESLELDYLVFDASIDTEMLGQLFRDIQLSHAEVHHLLRLPMPIVDLITKLNVPCDIYVHDYSWICPRVNLIDGSGKYCGEPDLATCEFCISKNGSQMEESMTVAELRRRSAIFFGGARRVFVPSTDAGQRLARYFPERRVETTPWESVSAPASHLHYTSVDRARVAIIGAIGAPKGYEVLLDCARDAAARDLDLEFTVIGYTLDDQLLLDTGRVFVTGPYQDEEVEMLLARERCNVALLPSVTPETWCYSLTHSIGRGIPTVAFDLGAQAERLRGYTQSTLLPLSSSAREVNAALLETVQRQRVMGQQGEAAMDQSRANAQRSSGENSSTNLESSVQVLNLPEGIYSFTVKDGGALRNGSRSLAVPALQVGIAPITSSGKAEFLNSASVHDRWLAYKNDMIVVRIVGGDSSLLLISVQMKDCPSISLDVKRLNTSANLPIQEKAQAQTSDAGSPTSLDVRLLAHIRYVGDLSFEAGQAGWPGQQMWIEGFAITSIADLPQDSVEYCGIMSNGFETPWIGNQALCGSRGGGLPLLGFAIRLTPEIAANYGTEYSGKFYSGSTTGPVRDGVLCSSQLTGDPLEVIEIRIFKRQNQGESSTTLGADSLNA